MVKQEPDQVVAVRLPLVHVAVIDHMADQAGVSRSELVRRIVAAWATLLVNNQADVLDGLDEVDMVMVDRATFERLNEADEMNRLYRDTFGRIEGMAHAMIASKEEMDQW